MVLDLVPLRDEKKVKPRPENRILVPFRVFLGFLLAGTSLTSSFRTDHVILSLDTTDEEAKSQFLEEIELMKAIGSHRNIVSMLGCWVNSHPIFLVLEYVPYGDLLHWLRNKRIQVNLMLHVHKQGWCSGESTCF